MLDGRFVIIGALLILLGSFSYLVSMLRGHTRPNRVTWFLWSVAPLITFAAQLQQGVGWSALMTFTVGLSPFIIFIGSFFTRTASWQITRFDVACGILALFALVLWYLTGSGTLAIILGIAADMIAGIPTAIKAYKYPHTENWRVFFFGAINAAIALLVIDKWDFAHWGFPVYILTFCVLSVLLVKYRLGVRIQQFADANQRRDVRS